MNKELFIVFLFLSLLMLLRNDKEGLRDPLVPPEYEFSILTAPQEVMSGYFQEELCRNDDEWTSGDKTCNDILNKDDCSLVGLNGVSANEGCLISCDTCPSSVTIKQREPISIGEDTDLSARGINFEDSDDYDYIEIYDNLQRAEDDISIINDIFYKVQKTDNYFDINNCIGCFEDIDAVMDLDDNEFTSECPSSCHPHEDADSNAPSDI